MNKLIAVSIATFILGSIITVGVLSLNTTKLTERTCDDIILYPNNDIVCEIGLENASDTIIVHEVK